MAARMIGWAHSQFGKSEATDVRALMAEVIAPAIENAGIGFDDVDACFVGVFDAGFNRQKFPAGLVSMAEDRLANVPAARLENACGTGSAALYAALDFIEAGRGRVALVVGAEKMTAVPTSRVSEVLMGGSFLDDSEADAETGFAGTFARITANYFQRYGNRSAELAMIAAKNHANAVRNPYAHIRKDLGFAFCNEPSEKNPIVAQPLRRTDCSLVSDGAAAIVVADPETAASMRRAVAFRGRAHANEVFALSRRDPTDFQGARTAWAKALAEAGVSLDDLDFVETHDCFTTAEFIQYEAMGLAEPGEAYKVVREGITARGGRLPVNLSGGLKAKGHPIGATGVSQHVMAAMQLCDEAGEMQLPGARLGGVFNMGGAAVTNYTSILERVR